MASTTDIERMEYAIDGYTVPVLIRGKQTATDSNNVVPLILLNGIGASVEALTPLMRTVEKRVVISFDVPIVESVFKGFGYWRMRRYADFTAKLLDELGYSCVDILGYSWGGALAQEFVHRYPGRVNKLILVATSPGHLMVPGRVFFSMKGLNPKMLWSPKALFKSGVSKKDIQRGGSSEADAQRFTFEQTSLRIYVQQYTALFGWSSLPWLKKIATETLILHARDDRLISSLNARILSRLIPSSKLVLSDKGGHFFLFRKNDKPRQMINEFLQV